MDPRRQPPSPTDKDSYSYDEMMERLRHGRSSGGNRRVKIQSPDGTVEIRKRKRRSHQPQKIRQERISRLRKIAIIGVALLVLLVIGIRLLLNVRYESDGFREGVSQRASELIGTTTTIEPITVKGRSIRSRRLLIEPPRGSILRDAEFMSVNGRLATRSMFSSDWDLSSLNATGALLRFQSPRGGLAANAQGMHLHATDGIPLVGAGFGYSSTPGKIHIEHLRVTDADFSWLSGRKEFVFLEDATLTSTNVDSRTDLKVIDSTLRIPGWPELELEEAQVSFTRDNILIDEALLTHTVLGRLAGEAILRGSIDLSGASSLANFSCQFDSIPVSSLIDEIWHSKLLGVIDGDLKFQADLSIPGSLETTGTFSIKNGSFGDVPPTDRLATFLAEPRLARIEFHELKGKVTTGGGAIAVRNIDALCPNIMRIGGSYTISADGLIGGELEVSISDRILNQIPGGKPEFFSAPDPITAMSSATVKLGGTRSEPTEDLTPRIEAAIEKFKEDLAKPLEGSYPKIPTVPGRKPAGSDDAAKKRSEEAFNQLLEP